MRDSDYKKRVQQQKAQYADMGALKRLPPIFRYWIGEYVEPRIVETFSVNSHIGIYSHAFAAAAAKASQQPRILSVGAGDGQLEVSIAEKLLAEGYDSPTIVATDLSEVRLERARELVNRKGLERVFEFRTVDVNQWQPEDEFNGVMAHHTLHHIVELEKTFETITDCLHPHGVFVVIDMIGRNGHMRWPETLELVESFWAVLPQKYKFNHQFDKLIDPYLNWDCSKSGFEGIRSQDILPLLCDHFSFSHFLGAGGFVDILVERGYGHNFDPDDGVDRTWIDIMARLNDALLTAGEIKPTMTFAVAHHKESSGQEPTRADLAARSAVRWP